MQDQAAVASGGLAQRLSPGPLQCLLLLLGQRPDQALALELPDLGVVFLDGDACIPVQAAAAADVLLGFEVQIEPCGEGGDREPLG